MAMAASERRSARNTHAKVMKMIRKSNANEALRMCASFSSMHRELTPSTWARPVSIHSVKVYSGIEDEHKKGGIRYELWGEPSKPYELGKEGRTWHRSRNGSWSCENSSACRAKSYADGRNTK